MKSFKVSETCQTQTWHKHPISERLFSGMQRRVFAHKRGKNQEIPRVWYSFMPMLQDLQDNFFMALADGPSRLTDHNV
jgi:hypothetical protein